MELLNGAGCRLLDGIGYPDKSDSNAIARDPDETSCLLTEPVGLIGQLLQSGNTVVLQECLPTDQNLLSIHLCLESCTGNRKEIFNCSLGCASLLGLGNYSFGQRMFAL